MAQGQRQIWESITRQISVKWWYLLESRTRAEVAAVKPALLKRSYILSICIKETSYIWKLFHIRFRLYIYLFFLYVISLDGYLGSGTLDPNKERHGFLEMFVLMGRVLKDFKVLDKYWKTVELKNRRQSKCRKMLKNVEKLWSWHLCKSKRGLDWGSTAGGIKWGQQIIQTMRVQTQTRIKSGHYISFQF